MKILLLASNTRDYAELLPVIIAGLNESSIQSLNDSTFGISEPIYSQVVKLINNSDLIIADVSGSSPNTFLELGIAFGIEKPTILIASKDTPVIFDIKSNILVYYERGRITETLITPLKHIISSGEYQQAFHSVTNPEPEPKTAFVSYSHADEAYLKRLEVHIKPFERAGKIQLWSDTKIKAGEKWKDKIEQALGKSSIAILLISADFLASDFIIDNELPPLLKAAEEKGTTILPVILKPCRFTHHPVLSKFQAINNPAIPLSKMDENGREDIYVSLCDFIESSLT